MSLTLLPEQRQRNLTKLTHLLTHQLLGPCWDRLPIALHPTKSTHGKVPNRKNPAKAAASGRPMFVIGFEVLQKKEKKKEEPDPWVWFKKGLLRHLTFMGVVHQLLRHFSKNLASAPHGPALRPRESLGLNSTNPETEGLSSWLQPDQPERSWYQFTAALVKQTHDKKSTELHSNLLSEATRPHPFVQSPPCAPQPDAWRQIGNPNADDWRFGCFSGRQKVKNPE